MDDFPLTFSTASVGRFTDSPEASFPALPACRHHRSLPACQACLGLLAFHPASMSAPKGHFLLTSSGCGALPLRPGLPQPRRAVSCLPHLFHSSVPATLSLVSLLLTCVNPPSLTTALTCVNPPSLPAAHQIQKATFSKEVKPIL